jgi:hypothetical protein
MAIPKTGITTVKVEKSTGIYFFFSFVISFL